MDKVNDAKTQILLSDGDGGEISPQHRTWMNEQISATLAKKARGEMNYTSLDDVRREFGIDAS